MENKKSITKKNLIQARISIENSNHKEIELEKKTINEELERSKRYLIEEVLYDGKELLNEIERKGKKSVWNRILDFIFK